MPIKIPLPQGQLIVSVQPGCECPFQKARTLAVTQNACGQPSTSGVVIKLLSSTARPAEPVTIQPAYDVRAAPSPCFVLVFQANGGDDLNACPSFVESQGPAVWGKPVHLVDGLATPAAIRGAPEPMPLPPPEALSKRECDVLQLLARGYCNTRIGAEMGIAERTVRFHLRNIYDKLGGKSRGEAIAWALREGFGGG